MNPNWQKGEWQYSDVFDEALNIKIFVNNRFQVEYSDTGHAIGAPLL
jgi:hypothetical protein